MKKTLDWHYDGSCIRTTSHGLDASGYPQRWNRRIHRPMRIARTILMKRSNYSLPSSTVSRHTCDNRWCINPGHIISGTRADNNHDMDSRGRRFLKLSDQDVASIRESSLSCRQLARIHGVCVAQIHRIKTRKQRCV